MLLINFVKNINYDQALQNTHILLINAVNNCFVFPVKEREDQ
jgi:hypothetical protein